jgi:transposase InsO family protein
VVLCALSEIKSRTHYQWRKGGAKRAQRKADDDAIEALMRVYSGNRLGILGYRSLRMKLREKGHIVNHKRIARVMRERGLLGHIRRAKSVGGMTKKGEEHAVVPNLVRRMFDPLLLWPHRVFGTDITYIPIGDAPFAYLSVIKDFCTGEVVAYALSLHPDTELVLSTLDRFVQSVPLPDRLGGILHSDQGCTYTAKSYQIRTRNAGLNPSMSRRGNCIDNAPTESFFGHMKDELPKAKMVYSALCKWVDDYMLYYNTERCQWNREKMTPVGYRDHLLETSA